MDFLSEYGLFLLQAFTLLVLVVFGVVHVLRAVSQGSQHGQGCLNITLLDEQIDDMVDAIEDKTLSKKARKKRNKIRRKEAKKKDSEGSAQQPRLFVLDFDGDIRASATHGLREEVTALLAVATDHDEVLVRLRSPGGIVHGYGLAAAQLARIREKGLKLTVAIDSMAASGGYLMASVADHILAAPMAIVGSIGVVTIIPNLHRFLKKHDVDVEMLTAGEYKRTLTILGENRQKDRLKMHEQLEDTHELFKAHIAAYRPALELDKVATGEYWYGSKAMELGLIDEVGTSDDFLLKRKGEARLVKMQYMVPRTWSEKFALGLVGLTKRGVDGIQQADNEAHYL